MAFCMILLILYGFSGVFFEPASAKVISGVLSSRQARFYGGQFITKFCFHGEGMFKYTLNASSTGRLYFYIEEKWLNLMTINTCKEKLAMAQYTHQLTELSGEMKFEQWTDPYIWYIVYADDVSCDPSQKVHHDVQYTLELYNPDSKGNPQNHFSYDETGLLSFYELLGFLYFAGTVIYGQRLWQTIQKGGPMHLVIKFLTKALVYHGSAVCFTLIHLFRYSGDGIGFIWLPRFSIVLKGLAEFEMLSMMSRLCIGYTLSASHSSADPQIISKVNTGVVAVSIIKVIIEILSLNITGLLVQLVLAGGFSYIISKKIIDERSTLRREFYSKFMKGCLLWLLAAPFLALLILFLPAYLRYKISIWGLLTAQTASILWLYNLFLSRSLYWEVSSLSASTLPLRHDRNFGGKSYNSDKRPIGMHKSVSISR
ncbi:integral membrane protein GPR180-like [Actinia tenebrosa]|uniref:Integral membrane protein GPR180-like n=1 Tax=Actinia tenebrosa TaxID=6105 RepID=A0A6P8HQD8_ACTTE|nr:integral membrane protein GPR180-like [Actinia tenebrosa]